MGGGFRDSPEPFNVQWIFCGMGFSGSNKNSGFPGDCDVTDVTVLVVFIAAQKASQPQKKIPEERKSTECSNLFVCVIEVIRKNKTYKTIYYNA